ncbi:phosphomannomutase/phosphoglucomutase [Tessaracoccus sp. MC1865]|uniref:phosphomannomutase/phosphoglucomutase n=1 Tax=Tessaracoccus sp. MC1865 TaxID=2760310 RepID=UPI0016045F7E|nr:phosphomannomutase/phosphoglucomutase [Tessaracoccus sp. MC1865]MBB1484504.1 phosphomannomutase/phosphoglucomutase [Tessaracoccus sp. MC1865]QTO38396.1 phosphomannomutase/phosphoglucomutase [Tessaracoccus sp. MC1865]
MLERDIFKANDIRGIVVGDNPQWDLDGARALGAAFVELLEPEEFVLGRDMRVLGRELSWAFIDGARRAGASVVDIGLSSTDQLWFASGQLSLPGVQFTASHNPSEYNGIKFCLADARPVPPDFMNRLRDLAATVELGDEVRGEVRELDCLEDYADKLGDLVPATGERELTVVVDAGNGMAGHTALTALAGRSLDIVGLYLDLDGSFPNHPANPLEPANLVDAQRAVVDNDADLGLVFDGDADRCFIIDEQGEVVDPSVITAMIAVAELAKHPGSTIVTNTITSWGVGEAVEAAGGTIRQSRVGHTYVKALMAETGAVFGGEHSAHYYFRDFWSADTGMLAALHVIELLRSADRPLSQLAAVYDSYRRSGELNSTVDDAEACMDAVAAAFEGRGEADRLDGLSVRNPTEGWWINLRPSNTEPLLRLNVEARNQATMEALRDEVLALVRAGQPD